MQDNTGIEEEEEDEEGDEEEGEEEGLGSLMAREARLWREGRWFIDQTVGEKLEIEITVFDFTFNSVSPGCQWSAEQLPGVSQCLHVRPVAVVVKNVLSKPLA